jgi:preprotein translocase subunit SecA
VLGGNLDAELEDIADPDEVERARAAWKERHAQVIAAGGLHVVGTERHESRRIDNQLRGRSGRQGDPGSSRFYLSLEDNLMRIFASDRVGTLMQKLGMEQGEAIEHPWVTKAIENAQRKVEGRNFDIRKQLLEFDDVANDQRKVIYQQRRELMDAVDVSDTIRVMREDVLGSVLNVYIPPESLEEQWDIPAAEKALATTFGGEWPLKQWLDQDESLHEETLRERILDRIGETYSVKEKVVGSEVMRQIEKAVMLQTLDTQWKDHLAAMDYLRQGIHLRGYAQKNPKQEYKREAFEMFSAMLDSIKAEVVGTLAKLQLATEEGPIPVLPREPRAQEFEFKHEEFHGLDAAPDAEAEAAAAEEQHQPYVREQRKVGRNEPCPCGSGKKYKHCCGRVA